MEKVPIIDNRFICIANIKSVKLSACVSSYFSDQDNYLPFFIFPEVSTGYSDSFDFSDDNYISMMMGHETATLINNAIARVSCECVVFIGLNEYQKSYLYPYLEKTKIKILEINDFPDIEPKLLETGIKKNDYITCRSNEILNGLVYAKYTGKALRIDENAENISIYSQPTDGVVIVENNNEVGSIIGINYGFSISATIRVVESISDDERGCVLRFIQKWYREGSHNQLQKVLNKIKKRIENIEFSQFKYATFFTEGLPYSLYIENCIPCSFVSLGLRPDLFVFNNIAFENIPHFHSAIVFSPLFFQDEETSDLISLLEKENFHTKVLVGDNATVGNFDFYVPHYPYDILHICSHGGEVDGYRVVENFTDRKGVKHVVEYDEVIGFSPVEGTDLISMHRKTIFKKFDDYIWRSAELRKQKYPNYIFEDMRKAMYQKAETGKDITRNPQNRIPTSCAIKCSDSIHQAMFQILASHSSPFVFNNTCWSWHDVATHFLAGGAKGYVGTLWAIDNDSAVLGAKAFYSQSFSKPIMYAVHDALKAIGNTSDKNIYLFWGLHFSTLEKPLDKETSRQNVFRELVHAFFSWDRKVHTTKIQEVKENSIKIIKKLYKEIKENFGIEDAAKLEREIAEVMRQIPSKHTEKREILNDVSEDFIEYPVKYFPDKK